MKRKSLVAAVLCLSLAYLFGRGVAFWANAWEQDTLREAETVRTWADIAGRVRNWGKEEQCKDWGLGFGAEGTQPTGTASVEELAPYEAYYMGEISEKVIYLTFDCGYENENTAPILDALKNQEVKAAFFVVGHYLESAPELVLRMVEEGHLVGNHTYHHPDMSAITDKNRFRQELDQAAEAFETLTGTAMAPVYRPPQGKYSLENLQMAKELGYHTFFWSLAYVDWNPEAQPTREEALKKLCARIHPGAVVLLHNTSRTNAEILEELIVRWKEMGYRFGSLEEFYAGADAVSETAAEASDALSRLLESIIRWHRERTESSRAGEKNDCILRAGRV